eukprot:TRINITY_DN21868_c0_g1_i1.p1 TRINITY_DN21868_c0_g1~~TRINITY_DN21868_c0_g1_i1.p1  ORF type:complete len:313 (+),score=20.53 TRINITY_DN21868_c0_g1_i1:62-1000(+)
MLRGLCGLLVLWCGLCGVEGYTYSYSTVTINNNRYSVATATSDPSKDTLLLMHGFPEGSSAWLELVPFLADQYNLVMPDQRGFNTSWKSSSVLDYTQDKLVSDVAAFAHYYSPNKKVHLFGHDWGGIVAWLSASRTPSLFSSLTILNSPHPNVFESLLRSDARQQALSSYIINFVNNPSMAQILQANDFGLLKAFFANETWFASRMGNYVSCWSQPGELESTLSWYRANFNLNGPSFGANLTTTFPPNSVVTIPTLVVWGSNDPAFALPENLMLLAPYVRNLTVHMLPASHWIEHAFAKDVAALFKEWVGGL